MMMFVRVVSGIRRRAEVELAGSGPRASARGEKAMSRFGIAIPAYRAAESVGQVVATCRDVVPDVPIVVVDDGSNDGTGDAARDAGARLLVHEVNRGKGAALLTAFAEASRQGWDAAITVDADGQHDPRSIASFIELYDREPADVIVGTRPREGDMPLQRRFSNATSSMVVSYLARARVRDSQSGYRLVSRRVWESLAFTRMRYDFESELLIKAGRAGMTISEVPIETVYGDEQSHFRPFADTWRMARVFLSLWWELRGS